MLRAFLRPQGPGRAEFHHRAHGLGRVLLTASANWFHHRTHVHAAALAFYTMVSLAPAVILAVVVASQFWESTAVARQIAAELRQLIGPEAALVVETVLENSAHGDGRAVAGVLGLLTLLFGATAAFTQLQEALNDVWEVIPKPGAVIRDLLHKRLLSFSMIVMVLFVLMVSLVLNAAVSALEELLDYSWAADWPLLFALNSVLSFAMTAVIFALIFRILPDVELTVRDVALGALLTAALFTLGKWLIGEYLGRTGVASSYGAAGSLAVFLLWVYYSSLILLFGAEFTRIYSRRFRPGPIAVSEGAERQSA